MAKRKASRRKTYGTKAKAKAARRKGQSVYKVTGGYRLSKRGFASILCLIAMVVCLMVAAFTCTGCSPAQLVQADGVVAIVDQAADAGQMVMDSPVGTVVKATPYGVFVMLGLNVLQGICNGWQASRGGDKNRAIREIVKGGEKFKADNTSIAADFKKAQAVMQSETTRKLVAAARIAA